MLHKETKLITWAACAMVMLFMVNFVTAGWINQFGIIPRSVAGLPGIALSPFLHASMVHLLGNLVAFVPLSILVVAGERNRYLKLCLFIIVVGGGAVWLIGRDANHVGASGLIFGLWAYLLATAWYKKSFKSLMIGAVVLVGYGSMIWGFMPRAYVSFEAHICGAWAGYAYAYLTEKLGARAITT
ncbi:membrane associated rhomboid family serine protease [Pseudomonas nitritireducens]|uniref:Membrane associated rhomboid family serine protease n=1 Tax=Pseudomonas nitroreducens TaxID=46680 RepID=A0A7W7KQ56_PSENT|nr:rhomboid family intramembrane serine protease [Pseudomonas nitritireducens]MBB4866816.1 membrane associated rhomboid family serine protease [Pseudomonas nitritireducens]